MVFCSHYSAFIKLVLDPETRLSVPFQVVEVIREVPRVEIRYVEKQVPRG